MFLPNCSHRLVESLSYQLYLKEKGRDSVEGRLPENQGPAVIGCQAASLKFESRHCLLGNRQNWFSGIF